MNYNQKIAQSMFYDAQIRFVSLVRTVSCSFSAASGDRTVQNATGQMSYPQRAVELGEIVLAR